MIVSEDYSLTDLGQEKPEMSSTAPYRVSANIVAGDRPAKGIEVYLLDSTGETVLQKKLTDATGLVYFDVADEKPVLIRPVPPKGMVIAPEEEKKVPLYVDRWWFSVSPEWEWSDSVRFAVGLPGSAAPGGQKFPAGKGLAEYLTLENILIGGAVLVGGYLLLQWVSGGDE